MRPRIGLTHLIHAVAGIVGSVLAVYAPLPGLLLAAAATVSAFGELTGSFSLVRSLTPARASQNVVSDQDTGKPGLIILVAHYDTPREAMLFGPRLKNIWPRAVLGSLALVTLCCIGRVVGLEATWFTIVQFVPTVMLIASAPLFADLMLADTAAETFDNDSGAAAAMSLAATELTHFDVMVVFTGASAQFALGMRAFLKRHRKEFDPQRTAVICLDNVGLGTATFAAKEGPVFSARMHPTLTELAAIDETPAFVSREVSDAYMARAAGLPAILLTSQGDGGDSDALARFTDYAGEMLERIDNEIGRALG